MNSIYEALTKDHDKVKSLLTELVGLTEDGPRRTQLVQEIRDELIPHSRAEEAVFYNTLRTVPVVKDEAWHGYKEHAEAETLLRSLQIATHVDAGFQSLAKKLKEALEHHISEEEGELFQLARSVVSDEESEQMARAFDALKPKVKAQGFLGTTVDLIANMMPPRFSKSFAEHGHKTLLGKEESAA